MSDTTMTGTIEHLDPHTLIIETNVRPTAPITAAFVQSIKENGVLTPVLAHRSTDGDVTVRAGQRRVFATREAGLASIPVYLVEADEVEVEVERIVQQMVENDHREALTDGDRAAAFQQLAFEGLSVTAIARRTGTKQRVVKTALAVTENPVTATAIQEHQLTLDQAAVLIEFDGEDDIRADLIQVATTDPAQFAHAAQRARDEKARVATKANAEAEVAGRGYTVLENDPGYYDIDYTRISELLTADDQRVTVEDIANAIVVGACESVTSKQTWRVPSPTDTAYFTQLAAWGYSLSDVEQIVIGEQQPTDSPAADNDATVNVEEQ